MRRPKFGACAFRATAFSHLRSFRAPLSGDAEIEQSPLVDTIAGVALSMGTLVPLVALANSDADVVSKTGGVADKNMQGVSLEVSSRNARVVVRG